MTLTFLAALLFTANGAEPLLTIAPNGSTLVLLDGVRARVTLPDDGPRLRTLLGEKPSIAIAALGRVSKKKLTKLDRQLAAAGLKSKASGQHGASTETALALLLEQTDKTASAPAPHGKLTALFGHSEAPQLEITAIPTWTELSGLYCLDEGEPVAWGVGSVSGLSNHALARTTADNRARVEIAKLIQTQISHNKGVTKSFTSMTLSGVQIIDHFLRDKEVWALASTHRDPPQGTPALSACPTGTKELRTWSWTSVTPDGKPIGQWQQPAWTDHVGMRRHAGELTIVMVSAPSRPLNEIEAELSEGARAALAASFTQAARSAPIAAHRSPTQVGCTDLPWKTIAYAEEPELWWHPEDGRTFARICIDLTAVAAAFEPGCPTDLPEALFEQLLSKK